MHADSVFIGFMGKERKNTLQYHENLSVDM